MKTSFENVDWLAFPVNVQFFKWEMYRTPKFIEYYVLNDVLFLLHPVPRRE